MSKLKRQQKLLDLIRQYEVETQDELINLLCGCGYPVTQATVSRDINDLQLIKIAGKEKKYRYAQVTQSKQGQIYIAVQSGGCVNRAGAEPHRNKNAYKQRRTRRRHGRQP